VGLHFLWRWLSANLGSKRTDTVPRRPWRVRWTFQIVTIIIFAFIAGISMVGITHQSAWLATSKEPLVSDAAGWHRFGPVRSRSNLHYTGVALKEYEKNH